MTSDFSNSPNDYPHMEFLEKDLFANIDSLYNTTITGGASQIFVTLAPELKTSFQDVLTKIG